MGTLEHLFRELNEQHFAGSLPLPRLLWNSRLSSAAGRFRPGRRIPLLQSSAEIEIASYLRDIADGEFHIRDTLLHEMVHYHLWHQRRPYGHTKEFHQILKRVGARRYNSVPKARPYKHWYKCPNCQKVIGARRRLKSSACLKCCNQFNGGQFSEQFRFQACPAPAAHEVPKPQLNPAPLPISPTPVALRAEAKMSPADIVRRLEEIKEMILKRA